MALTIDTFRPAHRRVYEPSRTLFIFCLLFAVNAALTSTALAVIKVEPGTTVQVGEEVFFDGSGVTITGAKLLPNGMIEGSYEWDFGDGYYLDSNNPYYSCNFGGTSTTHFYMNPGNYTVSLTVTDVNDVNTTDEIEMTVTGSEPNLPPRSSNDPVLYLKFENNLDDASPNDLSAAWVGDAAYVQGVKGKAADLTGGSYIEVLDSGLLSGMDELTISLWAKKNTVSSEGQLVDKDDRYDLALNIDWQDKPREVKAYVTTESGTTYVLKRDDEVRNEMWHHYAITYNGSQVRLFIDGVEVIEAGHAPKDLTGKIQTSTGNLLIGKKFDDPNIFDGYIDEVKIYDKALTPKEIGVGLELWHADFHGHTAQYIYAQIPTEFTSDSTNKINATITGDTGFSKVLLEKNNLQLEEKFLLNNLELPAGNYTLTLQILDASNNILDTLTKTFSKLYDGAPKVGIDENNSIRVNGELFFPVIPWLENHFEFLADRYINAFNSQHERDLTAWKDFLDNTEQVNLKTIGPGYWEGQAKQKSDPNKVAEYVNETKNHNAMLMWMWGDEPMINGVCAPLLRSWTYLCHKNDSQHLVDTNYAGHLWGDIDVYFIKRRGHNYLYSGKHFGGKRTHITDVMGFSYYPGAEEYWTAEGLAEIINRIREENYDLKPILSYVLVTKWDEFTPTSEQVRMNTWISVVRGAKGIKWYHAPVQSENYGAMAEFLDHITQLTPIVLGPEPNRTVTDNANESGNRVDTMVREDEDDIWIFAVRLTEVNEANAPPINVTFNIDGLTSGITVIEPGEFSQSVAEHHGDSNLPPARQNFSFTLANTPIMPGTVQVAGQYLGPGGSTSAKYRVYLFDDGSGNLYGIPSLHPRPTEGMHGTVNYTTGEVYVHFGQVKLDWVNWELVFILPGEDKVRATYRPVKGDRIIPHTGKTFTDTFAPNAVHIYRISLSDQGTKHAPVLASIGDKLVDENVALIFTVNATDADGDAITYSIQNKPSGATFSGQTFNWTPGYTQAGSYQVTFTASDGTDQDSETITITVSNTNRAPVLEAIGDKPVNENSILSFSISAADSDGDTITYSVGNLPTGATFGSQTLTWTPGYNQAGTQQVTFTASDGQAQDSETITVTINNVNRVPVLSAIGNKSVYADNLLTFSVNATDPDGDAITYSANGLPTGATFANQSFSWTPDQSQKGSYEVTFTASDSQLEDSETITITVDSDTSAPSVTNFSPAADSIQTATNTLVILHIVDTGKGVDANSATIKVNDNTVYTGNTADYSSEYGRCRRTGTKADYTFVYQPDEAFDFDQTVTITANATDLADNAMDEYSYSFKSEMRSFGENKILSSGSSNDNWGPLTTVSDSSGNIWVAWPQGVVGSRDIYVGKLVAGTDSFVSSGVVQVTNDIPDQGNPVIAVDSSDKLYLAWQDNRYGEWDIFVSTSTDGINWSAQTKVTDPNSNQINPAIAIDSSDKVYIAWEDDQNSNKDIYIASSTNSFATKTISQITSNTYDQTTPAIAVDSDDTVYVVWTDQRNVGGGKIPKPQNDIFGAASNDSWVNIPIVTKEESQSNPAIATEAVGSVLHLVWLDDTNGDDDIYYASTSNGLPSSPLDGSSIIDDTTGADQLSPVIITTGYTGNDLKVFACWRDERNADADLYFAETTAYGTNVFVGDDNTSSDQSEPAIGIDEYGQPYIVWINDRTDICYAGSTFAEPDALASENVSVSSGKTVGTEPAVISGVDDVSIIVPAAAYSCDVKITISRVKNPQKLTLQRFSLPYEFGPSGINFDQSVTITIPYEVSSSGNSASAYWYNPLTGTLSQHGITDVEDIVISPSLHALRFKTTHFTQFLVGGGIAAAAAGGGGGGGCSISPNSQGTIVEFLLPYLGLTVVMIILKLRDARNRKARTIAKGKC